MFCSKVLKIATGALALMGQACLGQDLESDHYINPVIPGWHSDPSCIQHEGIFLCVASTFIAFPGLPVYASKDLLNWKLASHVWSREEQLPDLSWGTSSQQGGMYAATIRFHDGIFYVICEYLDGPDGTTGVLFKTTDPYDDAAWSDPVIFYPSHIDPDLFWDDDGTVWMATHSVYIQTIDLDTGDLGEEILIWEGTGGVWPEGPHIYKKDGWYYLLIAEGGTGSNHAITIARAETITGPYESFEGNPILTNRGTDEYIQAVGHGDLFQDTEGNWWGLCLGIRDGPDGAQPMGRESFMFNVTWEEGEWPVLQPMRGQMPGHLLPAEDREDVPGKGPFVQDPDDFDFEEGSEIPPHFMYWRVPREDTIFIGDAGLEIVPSRANLTGIPLSTEEIELSGRRGLSFISRRQTHTLFSFGATVDFTPSSTDNEAGVTVFRTQADHIELGLIADDESPSGVALRFKAYTEVGPTGELPPVEVVPVPEAWTEGPIRLQITTPNNTHFEFSARPAAGSEDDEDLVVGAASAAIVSGGNGTFVGSLVGVYATCNGAGSGVDCPEGNNVRFTQWTYEGIAQQYDHDAFYPEV